MPCWQNRRASCPRAQNFPVQHPADGHFPCNTSRRSPHTNPKRPGKLRGAAQVKNPENPSESTWEEGLPVETGTAGKKDKGAVPGFPKNTGSTRICLGCESPCRSPVPLNELWEEACTSGHGQKIRIPAGISCRRRGEALPRKTLVSAGIPTGKFAGGISSGSSPRHAPSLRNVTVLSDGP